MFVVTLTYTAPIEQIEARTAEHRAWLDPHVASGLLILTGPLVPRTGGVLIARDLMPKEELMELLKDDPFQVHGLVTCDIVEFKPVKHNPALADLV